MAAKKSKATRDPDPAAEAGSRSYMSQSEVPAHSLQQALRVAQSLSDNFGRNATKPLRVAQAMNMAPGSSTFRMLCGASIAYGLTDGGYNADLISLTTLGRRIVAPTREGDDFGARREAVMRPRVIRDFLTRYNEAKLPPENIARNVLEELGVPSARAAAVFTLITESADEVGFLRDVKGQKYVDLDAALSPSDSVHAEGSPAAASQQIKANPEMAAQVPKVDPPSVEGSALTRRTNRVFITHGTNREIVAQLKELLSFGGFTPVVALENETVSKPVPDKVLDDMRSCDAAVIHVGGELRVMEADGKEHRVLNQNVLIEIGAAMALYGRKFILLVEKGATLPSNLQGLYEVRHEGGKLDYESTMRLLKAFNDFRS